MCGDCFDRIGPQTKQMYTKTSVPDDMKKTGKTTRKKKVENEVTLSSKLPDSDTDESDPCLLLAKAFCIAEPTEPAEPAEPTEPTELTEASQMK